MSEYDELLNQLTDRLTTAGKLIPRMCEALKGEGLRKDDINDKVTKDCLAAGLGRSTIFHNMPDEFKDTERVESGKKGQQKRQEKEIIVTVDGSVGADSEGPTVEPERQHPQQTPSTAYLPPEVKPEPVQQQPTKPIPDLKVIKYGTVTEAFNQIAFELKQVMDKQRPCKMGLLIFYT